MKVSAKYGEAFKPIKLEIIIEKEDELSELYYRIATPPGNFNLEIGSIILPHKWDNLSGLKYILGIYCKRREEGAEDD
jgi:hypothetical protein